MNIACTLLCHISLFLFSCIILRCIIKLPREKLMLAGPNNIRTKDSIVYISNISLMVNVVLNRIIILQQSKVQS